MAGLSIIRSDVNANKIQLLSFKKEYNNIQNKHIDKD